MRLVSISDSTRGLETGRARLPQLARSLCGHCGLQGLCFHKVMHATSGIADFACFLSYAGARSFRVVHIFFFTMHALGCAFYFMSRTPIARHYADAPWDPTSTAPPPPSPSRSSATYDRATGRSSWPVLTFVFEFSVTVLTVSHTTDHHSVSPSLTHRLARTLPLVSICIRRPIMAEGRCTQVSRRTSAARARHVTKPAEATSFA